MIQNDKIPLMFSREVRNGERTEVMTYELTEYLER